MAYEGRTKRLRQCGWFCHCYAHACTSITRHFGDIVTRSSTGLAEELEVENLRTVSNNKSTYKPTDEDDDMRRNSLSVSESRALSRSISSCAELKFMLCTSNMRALVLYS